MAAKYKKLQQVVSDGSFLESMLAVLQKHMASIAHRLEDQVLLQFCMNDCNLCEKRRVYEILHGAYNGMTMAADQPSLAWTAE